MTKLPSLTGKELLAVLSKVGFQVIESEAVIIFLDTQTVDQPWFPSTPVNLSVLGYYCESFATAI